MKQKTSTGYQLRSLRADLPTTSEESEVYRFALRERVLAVLHKNGCRVVGQVTEIGSRGLVLRYMNDLQLPSGGAKADIHKLNSRRFRIDRLPCRVVNDRELSNGYFLGPPLFRQCEIRFGALSQEQESQLKSLMEVCEEGYFHL